MSFYAKCHISVERHLPFGIGLSYRAARLHRLAGWYNKPMALLTLFPRDYEFC